MNSQITELKSQLSSKSG
jgi:hypothetical protein